MYMNYKVMQTRKVIGMDNSSWADGRGGGGESEEEDEEEKRGEVRKKEVGR